eukprot:COSAG06_NODE_58056_length_278_cov_0.581006_1_plen_51_part_10
MYIFFFFFFCFLAPLFGRFWSKLADLERHELKLRGGGGGGGGGRVLFRFVC